MRLESQKNQEKIELTFIYNDLLFRHHLLCGCPSTISEMNYKTSSKEKQLFFVSVCFKLKKVQPLMLYIKEE